MLSSKVCAFFTLCCIATVVTKKLPNYVQVCKRDQSTINACVRQSIEALRPHLAAGLPEIDMPGIDPFYIPEVILSSTDQLPINAVGRNIKVTGARNFTIKSLSVDLDTFTIRTRIRFPKLHLEGQYVVDTNIIVPIKGKGTIKADAVKCNADLVLRIQTQIQNGVEYVYIPRPHLNITIGDYYIRLEGLFNGDPVLGDATNQAINENRSEFFRAFKPVLEKTVVELLHDMANKIVSGIPLDEVFPLP